MRILAGLLLISNVLFGGAYVQVFRDGQPAALSVEADLPRDCAAGARVLAGLLTDPGVVSSAQEGCTTAFPPSARVHSVTIEKDRVFLTLRISPDELAALGTLQVDDINFQVVSTFRQLRCLNRFMVMAVDPADGRAKLLSYFLHEAPVTKKEAPGEERSYAPPSEGRPGPSGFLSGKTIFLSPGHGWYWTGTGTTWTTQRGVNCNIVEDFENAEGVDYFLTRYLVNAGAKVVTARERDMQTRQVIVDNGGANGASTYLETGAWSDSTLTGFAQGMSPYASGTSPFSPGGNRLSTSVTGSATASAAWTPSIPADGYYAVYVSFSQYSTRTTDAHYVVNHPGGQAHFRVNQQIDGFTWRYLGTFYFYAGLNGATGSVTLTNDSAAAGNTVSADAVRLGGGYGEITRNGATSGKPKWEECCRYWAQYQGAPTSVYIPIGGADNSDDVTCRPRYSEWEKDAGEDGVFVSWHSNALNGGCSSGNPRGTSTYIYSGTPSPGSVALQDAIHAELLADIRADWDAAWTDQGQQSADFGEVRALSTMPGVLVELAFHDNPTDAAALKNPKFKEIAARAIYHGICKYYSASATLLPGSPTHLWGKNTGSGAARIGWRAPDSDPAGGNPATGYRVYLSNDGFAFQDALATTNLYYDLTGLGPGQVLFFRVSAVNAGGESFPTETLALKAGSPPPKVLLVNGFDRMDAADPVWVNDTVGTNQRMVLDRMNAFNYSIEHAAALSAHGTIFDGASNEAVRDGDIALANYCAADWILAYKSAADRTFDATEQAVVQTYLSAGGGLFVSGSEIGWDLDYANNGRAFYNNYLKAAYLFDDPYSSTEVNIADGVAGTIFDGLSSIAFDNGGGPVYNVLYPDVIGASGGSVVNLNYKNASTSSISAGIQYGGAFKVVNLGFPFESIVDAGQRNSVMARVMDFLTGGCSGDTTSPAPVGDTLMWNKPLGRWEWAPVTLDRLGHSETMGTYKVRRSNDPALAGSVLAQPSAAYYADLPIPPASVCWFYQVTAVDAAGNGESPVLDCILDNPGAIFTGVWDTGTVTPGHWGDDYRFHATGGSGANTGVWGFTPGERGNYGVYVYYPQGANRSTASRFTVTHAAGSTLHTVNQQISGGTWVLLGTHRLEPGTACTITLDDAEAAGFVALADAVRWTKSN